LQQLLVVNGSSAFLPLFHTLLQGFLFPFASWAILSFFKVIRWASTHAFYLS
jgi:hypothetical protein